ncbi:MAG: DNA polymerase IV [Dehalococcoidia bacterium]|nr:MAG: DNA polymerase IV [Dehalococcoidia bacterium]
MITRIMHVDIDSFFASVEQVMNPDLKGKPVVVGGDPNGRGVVACASYEAREYGLKAGMSLAVAKRLCPHAIFMGGDFRSYRDASKVFMGILAEYTPEIESAGIDEAYLDLSGFEVLYGPAKETAIGIKRRINSELGITASIGIASSKVVAKVASDIYKPDGLVEVLPGDEPSFLAPLPVAKLPCVGSKTEVILKRMGIKTIGELGRLPLSLLKQSFGVHGEVMYRYANGIDCRKLALNSSRKSISRETTFNENTADRIYLNAVLHYLGEKVGASLRSQGRYAKCITIKVRYADFESITRSHTLRDAVNTEKDIYEVGRFLLDRALGHRTAPVRLIGIGVSNLTDGIQLKMFDHYQETMSRLIGAIDKIRDRHGFTTIGVGRTLPLKMASPVKNGRYRLETRSPLY